MNPRQILNNYRLGNMPGSMYKRGGSKGRKLPMAQFMVGNQAMNPSGGMGQGQTMLEQQTGPSQIEIANSVLAYANQLVEQGNYKDTRKGRQRAFDDAQIAHGLVTPKQKSNFLDYFNAVTGLLGPIATTYSTVKGAKNQYNNPSMSGGMSGGMLGRMYGGPSKKLPKNQFYIGQAQPTTKDLIDKGGDMTPEMRNAFIKRMAMNEQALRLAIQEQAAQQASGLEDVEIGIQPPKSSSFYSQPKSASFYEDMMNAAMQQRMSLNPDPDLIIKQMLQQGVSPDVKRKGGAKKKAKYSVGGPLRDKAPMPGRKSLPKVPQKGLGGAQQRVQQMKHGGSMCRGLPGGPNEFPR